MKLHSAVTISLLVMLSHGQTTVTTDCTMASLASCLGTSSRAQCSNQACACSDVKHEFSCYSSYCTGGPGGLAELSSATSRACNGMVPTVSAVPTAAPTAGQSSPTAAMSSVTANPSASAGSTVTAPSTTGPTMTTSTHKGAAGNLAIPAAEGIVAGVFMMLGL